MVLDRWRIIRTRERPSGASPGKGDIHRNLFATEPFLFDHCEQEEPRRFKPSLSKSNITLSFHQEAEDIDLMPHLVSKQIL